ncbi:RmlC-like cupin domain-containing protein [Cladochytrium replicatum]|nr:RmlC-like cupin domain-containing protein [Cladochytrium replicatum]
MASLLAHNPLFHNSHIAPSHQRAHSFAEPVAASAQNGLPHPKSLSDLCSILHNELATHGIGSDQVDVQRVQSIMESYDATKAEDWKRFALYDPSKPYTRNLVDDGNGNFNLMVLCWGEGQKSPIHDHSGAHCLMKVLDGDLVETQYHWPDEGVETSDKSEHVDHAHESMMEVKKTTTLEVNKVGYIHDKIGLHRVCPGENPRFRSTENEKIAAVSLHLYCPPFDTCRTFCERTGEPRAQGKCLFYSMDGKKVNYIEKNCVLQDV